MALEQWCADAWVSTYAAIAEGTERVTTAERLPRILHHQRADGAGLTGTGFTRPG
jgi:hypothetical protein